MKEIGGFLEFETYYGKTPHEDALAFNTARNCLKYLIDEKSINMIAIPRFLCNAVQDVCKQKNVKIFYYSINEKMEPVEQEIPKEAFFYFVNYYGQFGHEFLAHLKEKYKKLIVDNVQAFFQEALPGMDTIYTCRKFFGVPDGAYLYTDAKSSYDSLQTDDSFERMHHIMGRFEKTASEFYQEYVACEDQFIGKPVKKMSRLTGNILASLDYTKIRSVRTNNFRYLHKMFSDINKLKLKIPDGPYMYPLLLENGDVLRKKLQKEKLYIPTLWPNVFEFKENAQLEKSLAANILPLPVDQRYSESDMEYIKNTIVAMR